jgi:hypothetical protein
MRWRWGLGASPIDVRRDVSRLSLPDDRRERALEAAIGEPYRAFLRTRKRMCPYVLTQAALHPQRKRSSLKKRATKATRRDGPRDPFDRPPASRCATSGGREGLRTRPRPGHGLVETEWYEARTRRGTSGGQTDRRPDGKLVPRLLQLGDHDTACFVLFDKSPGRKSTPG